MTFAEMRPATGEVCAASHPIGAGPRQQIAYLLSQYPAISHTFLLHEVIGLRALGLHIECASINPSDRPLQNLPPLEADEAASTYYIKGTGAGTACVALLATLFARPSVLARGLGAILRLRNCSARERLYWLFYLAEAVLLGRWMLRRNLHHLHVHFGGAVASVGLLTSIAWRIPFSLTIHGPEELLDVDGYHLREKTRAAQFVVCISDFCKRELLRIAAPGESRKFFVNRLGVDPSALLPLHESEPRSTPELVCTGRLVAEKGHRILLEALLLLRQQGVSLRASFIGDGPERASLERFIADSGLADSVALLGSLPHPATLERVRSADIFALASFAEGVPVALMEAMAFELPCVATTIAGIPELIDSGMDGFLVAPGDPVALAEILARLASDAALRRSAGVCARQRIEKEYNLPANHKDLARMFRERIHVTSAQLDAYKKLADHTADRRPRTGDAEK